MASQIEASLRAELVAEEGDLATAVSKHRIKVGGAKHLRQIASILGHVLKVVGTENCRVVEMGSGR